MYHKATTLTQHFLEEEHRVQSATGAFTLLLTQLENAVKIIASHIKKTGLVDIIGHTGGENVSGDKVQKLDEFANALLVDMLLSSKQVYAVASEELDKAVYSPNKNGGYVVFLDPLDGSSNIDININMGTIFSIYHKKKTLSYKGNEQVAAGYVLYGPSVMLVYTTGNGVHGFTLDPSIGSFLLSHKNIRIPKKGSIYAISEGNKKRWDESVRLYIDYLSTPDEKTKRPYKLRYVGAMVADVHRTLLKGGVFIYPKDTKDLQGKLRLMYEINPLSFIICEAGGKAISNCQDPLTIVSQHIHQKAPIALGSPWEIDRYKTFLK